MRLLLAPRGPSLFQRSSLTPPRRAARLFRRDVGVSSTPGAPTPALTPVSVASPSLRSSSSKLAQLTLEQILEHLDNLRLNLTNTKQNCAPPSLRLRPP